MRRVAVTLAVVLAGLAVCWLRPPERVAYVGGAVLTMDTQDRVVSGVAIAGEHIAQVGSEAEIRAWAERAAIDRLRVVETIVGGRSAY